MWKLTFGKTTCIIAVFCVTAAVVSPAQTFTSLFSFDGTNGQNPLSLVLGFNGNLYGTTAVGGSSNLGTVFKISVSGKLTTLYSFCQQTDCIDGYYPNTGLMQAADGYFYGTTLFGGDYSCNAQVGCGTIFRISSEGTLTTMHSFHSNEGDYPVAGLIQARDGNFYGTTNEGGPQNDGTVFKITASGTLTTLYNFCSDAGCPEGLLPVAALMQGTDGNLYGTTSRGAASNAGTLFKITPTGELTLLDTFDGYDGEATTAPLIQVGQALYGVTTEGGRGGDGFYNSGTVFVSPAAGKLKPLYSFCFYADCVGWGFDGSYPEGLILAGDGNFYGTTQDGGYYYDNGSGGGTIFKITPTGTLTELYGFCEQLYDCADGTTPQAGLVQATNGIFYGTTEWGGTFGQGTVFSLSLGLGPFVESNPAFGKAGYKINILGNNLKSTTSVTFNGTPAAFAVISGTHIEVTVPIGATTGTIEVTTPTGALSSNVAFQVLP
jgi:uncharacterized repeat protein (TIGR03803 family)